MRSRFVARGSPALLMIGLMFAMLSVPLGSLGAMSPVDSVQPTVAPERDRAVTPLVVVEAVTAEALVMERSTPAAVVRDSVTVARSEPGAVDARGTIARTRVLALERNEGSRAMHAGSALVGEPLRRPSEVMRNVIVAVRLSDRLRS